MIYLFFFLLSVVLTFVLRQLAHHREIIDVPNARSLHEHPTPRGGGLAIVVVFFVGVVYCWGEIDQRLGLALLCALPVALIGLLDDIYSLPSTTRFAVHLLSAAGALYFLGGVHSVDMVLLELHGWWLTPVALISIVWLTNLYNFLDGIDGYAGSQAVTVGLGLFLLFGNPLGLVIAVAALGFLLFNWQKASIFMGDVGSTTLGFIFAIFAFSDTTGGSIYVWLILLSLFWLDATLTLLRRYRNKEKLTQAHKKHAFQRLAESGWSHRRIVLSAIVFNLSFLALLLFWDNALLICLLNILAVYSMIRLIDSQKGFYDHS